MKSLFRILATAAVVVLLAVVPSIAQTVPDFTQFGFPQVVATTQIAAGAAATMSATVTGGSITVEIPAGTFANAVKFDILTGPLSNFTAKAPSDDQPLMDFAFRVTDMTTNQLIGQFQKAVTMTARNSALTADSSFYNIDTAGNFDENPTGLQASAGVLIHPIPIATVGWVITTPKAELVLPASGGAGLAVTSRSLLMGVGLLLVLGGLVLSLQRRVSH